jgi:Signal transduction histidine kinase regulating citrate/malate metabolism
MDFSFLLKVGGFVTFPEMLLASWFSFRFFGLRPPRFIPRLILLAVPSAVLIVASLALVDPLIQPFAGLLLYLAVLSLVFPDLPWKVRGFLTLVLGLLLFLIELSSVLYAVSTGGGMTTAPADWTPVRFLRTFWPAHALLGASALWLELSGRSPGRRVLQFLMNERNRYIQHYAVLTFLQCFLLILLFLTRYVHVHETGLRMLFYVGIFAVIVCSFLTVRLIAKARDEAIRVTQEAFVGDLMRMITTIRGQRHDFVNHVQTMYAMLTMKKHEQLKQYMEEVVGEIQSVSRLAEKIPVTALESLLMAKQAIAQDRQIRFEYRLAELPEGLSAVRSIDLVRIVGNLVDNAFDEVMKRKEEARIVTLDIGQADGELRISVGNAGDPLTEDERKRIFTPGYSTKRKGHEGLGLPIVVERVRHYGGEVEVDYRPERGVVFTARIPINSPEVRHV